MASKVDLRQRIKWSVIGTLGLFFIVWGGLFAFFGMETTAEVCQEAATAQGSIYVQDRLNNACNLRRETDRINFEYDRLSKKFDLSKIRSYPEAERVRIYRGASVPDDGPRTTVEYLRVLSNFERDPSLYH